MRILLVDRLRVVAQSIPGLNRIFLRLVQGPVATFRHDLVNVWMTRLLASGGSLVMWRLSKLDLFIAHIMHRSANILL